MFGERFGVNEENALQNETEEMVEGPRDEAVIEQPQAKKPKIDEKEGGIDFTDELKKENMSDSYLEGGGVYGEVMKEEDECEMDEDEDEDEEEEEEEEEDKCEMDEGRHVDLVNQKTTPELKSFILRMLDVGPIEWTDEEFPTRALDTPLYKNCVEGFDVTHSDSNALGLLYSHEPPFEGSELEEWIISIAEVAINKYNQDHRTHWKYKETIKANYNYFHGLVYFITFKATHEDQDIKTFEAKVYRDNLGHNNYEDRADFVRIKS